MAEERTTSSTGGQKGVKLQRFDLIPAGPLQELAVLYGQGARKYDAHQWRKGYEWSKSFAAIQRHSWAWQAGLDFDVCSNDPDGCAFVDSEGNPFENHLPDACYNHTGVHHLVCVAWHSFLLLEFRITHPDHDDRWIPGRIPVDNASYEEALKSLQEYSATPFEPISAEMIPAVPGRHKAEDLDKVKTHYTAVVGARYAKPYCGLLPGRIGIVMVDKWELVNCEICLRHKVGDE